MSQQREEILQTLARHRDSIQRLGARRLGLFGSQARGEAAEGSDLDFLVDQHFPLLEDIEDRMDEIHELIFKYPSQTLLDELLDPRSLYAPPERDDPYFNTHGLCFVALWTGIVWAMHRRRWYWKV